jgi:hypothetical protein
MVPWSDSSWRDHVIGAQGHPTHANDQRRVQDHQRLHLGVFTQRPGALLNDLHQAVVLARQVVGVEVVLGEVIPRASEGLPDPRPLPGQRLWGPARALLMRGVWLRPPRTSFAPPPLPCQRPRTPAGRKAPKPPG